MKKKWEQKGIVIKCKFRRAQFPDLISITLTGIIECRPPNDFIVTKNVKKLIEKQRKNYNDKYTYVDDLDYWFRTENWKYFHHSQIDKRTIKILPQEEQIVWKLEYDA